MSKHLLWKLHIFVLYARLDAPLKPLFTTSQFLYTRIKTRYKRNVICWTGLNDSICVQELFYLSDHQEDCISDGLSHSLHIERMIEGQIDYAPTDTTIDRMHGVCLNAFHA